MKIFNVNWVDEMQSCSYDFSHETKTKEEFEEDLRFVFRTYGYEYLAKAEANREFVKLPEWLHYVVDKLELRGYKRIIPDHYTNLSGGYIIDADEQEDERQAIINLVGEDLYQKAIDYNIKFNEDMHKSIEEMSQKDRNEIIESVKK